MSDMLLSCREPRKVIAKTVYILRHRQLIDSRSHLAVEAFVVNEKLKRLVQNSHSPQASAWGCGARSVLRNRFNGLRSERINKDANETSVWSVIGSKP